MDRLDCLDAFVSVLECGSFSKAARRLNTTQSTISKRIAKLENEFGTNLFLRSTRRLAPTPEAKRIYPKVRETLDSFDLARDLARDVAAQPSGTLRLDAPSSLGRNLLMPVAAAFMREYPRVKLDIRLSERRIDLVEEGVELALRIGELPDSSLRARPLGKIERVLVAGVDYLHGRSAPRDPSELKDHACISYSRFGDATQWALEGEDGKFVAQVNCVLELDDADMMRSAVVEGVGIAILPAWLATSALASKEMQLVLPGYGVASLPLHAVYPEPGKLSLRARQFLDFLVVHRNDLTLS